MIPHRILLLSASLAIGLAAASLSQTTTTDPHAGHSMATDGAKTPATAAFKAASARMHVAMDVPYTGNPDVDFIAGMMPHHQGAVDAARIVLQYGEDPEVRKFAQGVIAAQEAEIAWMTDWMERHGQ